MNASKSASFRKRDGRIRHDEDQHMVWNPQKLKEMAEIWPRAILGHTGKAGSEVGYFKARSGLLSKIIGKETAAAAPAQSTEG